MDKYQQFKAVDFLEDESFLSWAKSPAKSTDENSAFWNEWLIRNPDNTEIQAAIAIVRSLNEDEETADYAKKRTWDRLQRSVQEISEGDSEVVPIDRRRNRLFLQIAASVAIVLSVIGWQIWRDDKFAWSSSLTVLENIKNTPTTVMLPDGSSVVMEPGSKISFPDQFEKDVRMVEFSGKGFFEVAKNKDTPFVVRSSQIITKVVGTSFHLNDVKGNAAAEVEVLTGIVTVFAKEGTDKEIIHDDTRGQRLTQSQGIRYSASNNRFDRIDADVNLVSRFQFNETPITEVLDVIEDVYNVNIITDREVLKSCAFNASLADMTLEDKIDVLCKAIGYEYEITGEKIKLTGQGCP